jgi:pimeloyl-ACP methyl ester carboxylesterase
VIAEVAGQRTVKTLILKDGRRLGFAESGAQSGLPVFYFHGSGSSRFDRPSSESMLAQRGIRFITTDRPGHGQSECHADRRLIDWPQDVGQLADHLGIGRFYVAGHSAGGPHALACAHQLPDRVIAGAAISSVAPMSRRGAYAGMPLPNRLLAWSARHAPWVTQLIRRMTRNMVMGDAEQASRQVMASIPEADKVVLYAPENADILVRSLQEGFRQGGRAVAQDDSLVNQDWGFDLAEITPRIDVWHGEADVNVPFHAGQYLAGQLANARATFLEGEGHFFVLARWEEILVMLLDG